MRVAVRTLLLIVVGIGLLCGPFAISTAQAEPRTKPTPLAKPALPEAREHLALGNKLYNVRSFDEAGAEYKAGALIEPAPVFDYNLGQCYRLTGKYKEAIWHYERFLERGKPEGKLLDSVNDFVAQMKSELDKKAMTQKPTEPAPTLAPVISEAAQPTQTVPPPELRAARTTDAWYSDSFGWGLAGAGVVGVAVGGGLLSNASSLRADANASTDQDEYRRLSDKASTRTLLGTVVGVGGAGLLVTGVIKLAMHTKPSAKVAGWNLGASRSSVFVFATF